MKKQLLSILLCLSFSQPLFAQTVTDFTGTDLDGNSHRLFEYLDAGKYVLIEFIQTQWHTCQEITGPVTDLYLKFGCNEGDVVVLCAEVTEASKTECIQFKDHYNAGYPLITSPDGAKIAVDAVGGITSVPTCKLIGPDHTILTTTSTNITQIETELKNVGVSEQACENLSVVKDTINPTANLVADADWGASTDSDGSNVISQASVSGGVVSTTMHIDPYKYPDGPWTWGNLTGSVGKILDKKEYIKVTYKASNDLIVEFPMEPLNADGKNFGKRISARNDWSTELLDITTFAQPVWANDTIPLDMSKIEDVVFSTFLAYDEDVDIEVKEVVFYERGQTDVIPQKINPSSDCSLKIIGTNKNGITVLSNFSGGVTVQCYTCDGRLIMTTEDEIHASGIHSISFKQKKLSQGVYVLKLYNSFNFVSEMIHITQ